jgi:hypothetical protein
MTICDEKVEVVSIFTTCDNSYKTTYYLAIEDLWIIKIQTGVSRGSKNWQVLPENVHLFILSPRITSNEY